MSKIKPKTITVQISQKLFDALEEEAKNYNVSKQRIVREAIVEKLEKYGYRLELEN